MIGVSKGKCFCIGTSPENFDQSPESLKTYNHLMDEISNDEDMYKALIAEEDLQQWTVQPFLPLLDEMELLSLLERHLTLQDYLYPETYRFVLYVVKERQEPCFDYDVPTEPGLAGVDLGEWTVYSKWKVFQPSQIQLCCGQDDNEVLSKIPRKVIADGETYFYKPLDHDDKECAVREMETYKRLEHLGADERLHVPRLYGVVQDKQTGRVLGLMLSWINCENKTLECALAQENPSAMLVKWDQQVSTTLACLHEAGIIWGDATAGNILIDTDDNAWIIDFGGGYTRGWVGKDRMETIEGDQEGLSKIKELLHQGFQRGDL
ncbi:Protein kinase domain protein [Aspergillus sclerotialis]|uniref:Protein kinase domain protein n=1 Tax=Aspergillus sclerotialis TaxID=2070753 RepID=A0A3A2ZDH8_9EURO|nr:Protein kinase domain protein [Aspergillus sclerotialis]